MTQKVYGWEPAGSSPTYLLQFSQNQCPDLGDDQTQRALIGAAEIECQDRNLLSCALMVRNESERILQTLESLRDVCDQIWLLDTGSTDDTVKLATQYCNEHQWPIQVFKRPFDDFATSRNFLLSKVSESEKDEFIFLADCNDQLVGTLYLKALCALHFLQGIGISGTPTELGAAEWAKNQPTTPKLANLTVEQHETAKTVLPCQYYMDVEFQHDETNTRYTEPMVRLVRNNCGWRYSGPVHEILWNDWWQFAQKMVIPPEKFKVVQNKTVDSDGSQQRWPLDLALLENFLEKHPNQPRALYYRAKTLRCLQKLPEAVLAYQARCAYPLELETDQNELYQAHYGLAQCTLDCAVATNTGLNGETQRSVESSCWTAFRMKKHAEPLLLLYRLYLSQKDNWKAFMVSGLAIRLPIPFNQAQSFDLSAYSDQRYANHAIILWQMGACAESIRLIQYAKSLAAKSRYLTPILDKMYANIQSSVKQNESLQKTLQSQSQWTSFDAIQQL